MLDHCFCKSPVLNITYPSVPLCQLFASTSHEGGLPAASLCVDGTLFTTVNRKGIRAFLKMPSDRSSASHISQLAPHALPNCSHPALVSHGRCSYRKYTSILSIMRFSPEFCIGRCRTYWSHTRSQPHSEWDTSSNC